MKLSAKDITICGLFVALIVVGTFIRIDIPLPFYTMHFTLQWLFVLLVSLLLGAKLGTLTVASYLALGLAGIPVFAAGGGLQYIFRPGFGFLLGFLVAAFVMGFLIDRTDRYSFTRTLIISTIGLVIYYAIGAIYFYFIKNIYGGDSIPFKVIVIQYCLITVLPDFLLCAIASKLSLRLRSHISRS